MRMNLGCMARIPHKCFSSDSLHPQLINAAQPRMPVMTPCDNAIFFGRILRRQHRNKSMSAICRENTRFCQICGMIINESCPTLRQRFAYLIGIQNTLSSDTDVVICSEVIEHLENPRYVFRMIHNALSRGGTLVLTQPNQESIRSYLALIFRGHFVSFLDSCYPAHITALVRKDLERICVETGFCKPIFYYSDNGGIPKLPNVTWQQISLKMLAGRLFSDNVALVTRLSL